MELETKRLILRKPVRSDWKDLVDGLNEKNISEDINLLPYPYTKKDALKWINTSNLEWRKKDQTAYTFVIELKSEKKVIGAIAIHDINKQNKNGITGSWINKRYRRKGYITEAKIAINDFAFNRLKLIRLGSTVYAHNKASQNVQTNVGYVLEGVKRKSIVLRSGKIVDCNIYGLLKEDWKMARLNVIKDLNGKIKEREK